jgi:hypothetical protein
MTSISRPKVHCRTVRNVQIVAIHCEVNRRLPKTMVSPPHATRWRSTLQTAKLGAPTRSGHPPQPPFNRQITANLIHRPRPQADNEISIQAHFKCANAVQIGRESSARG